MSAIALHARPSRDYALKLDETRHLLSQSVARFQAVALACSLGAEDMVLVHLVNVLRLPVDIFVLDTGRLHPQTLELLAQLQATSARPVSVVRPDAHAAAAFVQREGEDAMRKSVALRKQCCAIRKLEPLERALRGKDAWITGLRREQSDARADVPLVDESQPRAKLNPLANWTWGDVWHTIATQAIAYNPLHDAFYPSIGCAPCTRAVSIGEDFRAGRWWWELQSAKECGLHTSPETAASALPLR